MLECAEFRPPAPVPRPELPGLFDLLRTLRTNPLEAWTRAHFEEPAVAGGLPIWRVLVVSEPRAIRRVLVDNAANYEKDWIQRRVLSAGLGGGLLTAEGNQWRVQRRTLQPLFARKAVAGFAPEVVRAVDALVGRWRRQGEGVVDVAAEVAHMALDVLTRTIFSDGLGRDPEQFRAAMSRYFEIIGRIEPFDVLGLPDFVPRPGRLRARATLRFFDRAIDEIVAARRRQLAESPATAPRDLLTLLLEAQDPDTDRGLGETEVRANILTFISAGHATTADAVTWSLFLLSRSEAWREEIVSEAERELDGPVDDLAGRLVATRAVLEEALRLYPPIAAVSRVALGPDELAGHRIGRGTMVVVAPYVLHRHRRLWDRPDLFDPHRFLPGAREAIDRFAYLPFGVGPRVCIGSAFALQEATIALATIVRHFELMPVPRHEVRPVLRITLRPAGGLPMAMRPRHAAS